MPRRPDARTLLFERIRTSPPKFVQVTGVPYVVEVEPANNPADADHVWLTLEVPLFGRLRAVINTVSRLNRDAGFDSRIRLAVVKSTYADKPQTGLLEVPGFDYAKIEAKEKVTYKEITHEALCQLLLTQAKAAIRAEVWGDLYARDHLGIHQIHCRRASSAVPLDIAGRDGALKLYLAKDNVAELYLFKFSGQR